MYFLNTESLDFEDHPSDNAPQYAALSHRWKCDETTEQERLWGWHDSLISVILDEELELLQHELCGEQSSGKSSVLEANSGVPYSRKRTEMSWAISLIDVPERSSSLWFDNCCIDESSSTERTKSRNSVLHEYLAARGYYDSPNEGASFIRNLDQQQRKRCASYLESKATSCWCSLTTPVIGFDDMNRSHADIFNVIFSSLIKSGWFSRGWRPEELLATAMNLSMFHEAAYWIADGGTPRKGRGHRKNMAYWQSRHTSAQLQCRIHPMLSRFGTLLPEPSKHQLFNHGIHDQRGHGFAPEARDQKAIQVSDAFIGDEGIGPQAGKPDMGREDDDDDDCVGFRRFSGPRTESSGLLYEGGDRHGKARPEDLQLGGTCGSIPKYGPPKRDPVAAAMSSPVKHPLDESTLRTWRDAIARTCGAGADLGSMKAEKWEDRSWQSDWNNIYCNGHHVVGGLLCAY